MVCDEHFSLFSEHLAFLSEMAPDEAHDPVTNIYTAICLLSYHWSGIHFPNHW